MPITFVNAGTVATGTTAISPALPASIQTGDILLLFLQTNGQTISIANQNGGTWTEVADSPQGTTAGAGSGNTLLTVFWSRYNGTQGDPTTSDSGNRQLGRIVAFRGCKQSGDPWNVTAGNYDSSSNTSGSITGDTTTVDGCMVVAGIGTGLPDSTGTANFGSWANANLASITEATDNTSTSGNGGGLGVAYGIKTTAGDYGATTVTLQASALKGCISIALQPAGNIYLQDVGGATINTAAIAATLDAQKQIVTAPYLVSFTSCTYDWDWIDNVKASPNISWLAGDLVVILALSYNATSSYYMQLPTATGLTFTEQKNIRVDGYGGASVCTAIAGADGGPTPVSMTGSGWRWGYGIWVFRYSQGVGNSVVLNSTARVVSLTPTAAHGAIVWGVVDRANVAAVTMTPTPNNLRKSQVGTDWTFYCGDLLDQTSAGAVDCGITGWGTGPFSIIALEIKARSVGLSNRVLGVITDG